MLIKNDKGIVVATEFNSEMLTLNDSLEWSIWLKRVRDLSDNTVRVFMKSMERFWIWSLYNPVEVDESFPSFQARYREALRNGFAIAQLVRDDEFEENIEIEVLSCKPLQKITINKEIAGINSYFYFTEEHDLLYDHRYINYLYEQHKSRSGFLSSIQIKKSNLALQAFGEFKKYLPSYKISKNKQELKYFPTELYDALLEVAKPRERLIYLLCGSCSARIGQALNLTLYDIDYDNGDVWLIDPKSDNTDIYGNKRREWLRDEYNIDILDINCEHNTSDIQFKYPIPLTKTPLFWINEDKYRNIFFKTLKEYHKSKEYVAEMVRYPRHPFLFTTSSGRRVHARDTLNRFKTNMRKVVKTLSCKRDISGLGLHSLRHMFGHSMAELYAATGDDSIIKITQEAMGHSNLESTMVYFSISSETMRNTLKKLTHGIYSKDS